MTTASEKLIALAEKFEKRAQEFGEEDLSLQNLRPPMHLPINDIAFSRLISAINKNAINMQSQVDRLGGIDAAIKRGHVDTLLAQLREISSAVRVLERRLQ